MVDPTSLEDLKDQRESLKTQGFNICFGELCKKGIKQLSEFPKNSNTCKKCTALKAKKYYYESGGKKGRKLKNTFKRDKCCVNCGEDNISLLEFDHHTGVKNENIVYIVNKEKFEKEVLLTQILCIWCHRQKSYQEVKRLDMKEFEIYRDLDESTGENTKKCPGLLCKNKKRDNEMFYFRKYLNNGSLSSHCKKCVSYSCKIKRMKNKKHVIDKKLEIGNCQICGIKVDETNYMCFDFDHLRDKTKPVSFLQKNNISLEKIDEEIAKCQLLCCKCHKLKTDKQLNTTIIFLDNKKCKICSNIEVIKNKKDICDKCYNLINELPGDITNFKFSCEKKSKQKCKKESYNLFNELPGNITNFKFSCEKKSKIQKCKNECYNLFDELPGDITNFKFSYEKKSKVQTQKPETSCKKCNKRSARGICFSCYNSENKVTNTCQDCKKPVLKDSKRCLDCYKLFRSKNKKVNSCIDCKTKIKPENTRCKDCYKKISIQNIRYGSVKTVINCSCCKKEIRCKNVSGMCGECYKKDKILQSLKKEQKEKPKVITSSSSSSKTCLDCNKAIFKTSTRCGSCAGKLHKRKVERPSYEKLKEDLIELRSYVATGKRYGVSDNAIRKWIKVYEKEL